MFLFSTKLGITILSILWGFGLSLLFGYSCKGTNCKISLYKGPPVKEMENTIFNYGTDKCYSYYPILSQCELKQS